MRVLTQLLGVQLHLETDPVAFSARIADPGRVVAGLTELSRSGIAVSQFSFDQPSLDEVFLTLTGRPAARDEADNELEIA